MLSLYPHSSPLFLISPAALPPFAPHARSPPPARRLPPRRAPSALAGHHRPRQALRPSPHRAGATPFSSPRRRHPLLHGILCRGAGSELVGTVAPLRPSRLCWHRSTPRLRPPTNPQAHRLRGGPYRGQGWLKLVAKRGKCWGIQENPSPSKR
jgi:hypothetical protein